MSVYGKDSDGVRHKGERMMNEAFTFYGSFYDAIKELDDADRLAVYDAICSYGITGEVPELSGVAAMAFKLMRPNIDANLQKRAAGRKGGEAEVKHTESTPQAELKQNASTPQADANQQNITEQNKTEQDTKERRARFSPPTREEVVEYCRARQNSVDPDAFVDFYTAKGWKVGNQSMKDWKAAVRTWERRGKAPPKVTRFGAERRTDYDQMERELRRVQRERARAGGTA